MQASIRLLEQLVEDFPIDPRFRYELADTLSLGPPPGTSAAADAETRGRLERAKALAVELHEAFGAVPEYRELVANTRGKLAAFQRVDDERSAAGENLRQALDLQTGLVEQFPLMPGYRLAWARTVGDQADLARQQGQLAESRESLEKALVEFEAWLKTADAEHAFLYRRVLAGLQRGLADTLRDAGESDLATHADERTAALEEPAASDSDPALAKP